MENTKRTEDLANEILSIIDNIELDKKTSLPKYSEYGYSSITVFKSNGEYFLTLTQEATSDYCTTFKRFGDAKKRAKKIILNHF